MTPATGSVKATVNWTDSRRQIRRWIQGRPRARSRSTDASPGVHGPRAVKAFAGRPFCDTRLAAQVTEPRRMPAVGM